MSSIEVLKIKYTGVDIKVSKALAHRASTGQVQLARM
jgi:hypothetical protein